MSSQRNGSYVKHGDRPQACLKRVRFMPASIKTVYVVTSQETRSCRLSFVLSFKVRRHCLERIPVRRSARVQAVATFTVA